MNFCPCIESSYLVKINIFYYNVKIICFLINLNNRNKKLQMKSSINKEKMFELIIENGILALNQLKIINRLSSTDQYVNKKKKNIYTEELK